jgi:hypothetical protein
MQELIVVLSIVRLGLVGLVYPESPYGWHTSDRLLLLLKILLVSAFLVGLLGWWCFHVSVSKKTGVNGRMDLMRKLLATPSGPQEPAASRTW